MKRRRTSAAVARKPAGNRAPDMPKTAVNRGKTAAGLLPVVDHGSTGLAMLTRPSRMVETIVAGVTARQTVDSHLIDRMARAAQLTGCQPEAAQKVLEMATAAGVHLGTTAGWSGGGRAEMSDDMAEAHAKWSRMMVWVGSQNADLLTDMVHGKHPGTWRLATLQSALDKLAHRWKMEG